MKFCVASDFVSSISLEPLKIPVMEQSFWSFFKSETMKVIFSVIKPRIQNITCITSKELSTYIKWQNENTHYAAEWTLYKVAENAFTQAKYKYLKMMYFQQPVSFTYRDTSNHISLQH